MALIFRLNGTRIYPIVNTTLTERIGTFSDGTLPLALDTMRKAILPMSNLTIEDDTTNSKWQFVVVADNVENATKDGNYWKHNLTVRSGIYESTKHVLRNNTFSQPPKTLKGKLNFCVFAGQLNTSGSTNFSYNKVPDSSYKDYSWQNIKVSSRTKISKVKCVCHTKLYVYQSRSSGGQGYVFTDLLLVSDDVQQTSPVALERYDNGVLTRTVYGIQNINDKGNSIYRNLTDNTEFRLVQDKTEPFVFTQNYGIGAFAKVSFTLELETYYYSMFDIIEQLYLQSCKRYNGNASNDFDFLKVDAWEDFNELSNIVAPEISFNGMTIYDALYTLLSYIDAIPVVDDNGYLTYEYLNDNNAQEVTVNKADEKIVLSDEYYTNKLVANYQNGRQENSICYPSKERYCRVGTKTLGIPSKNDYCLRLPKPIDFIDKVKLGIGEVYANIVLFGDGTITVEGQPVTLESEWTFGEVLLETIDITNQVVDTTIYDALNADSEYYMYFQQMNNCLSYARGSNYIDLMGEATFTVLTKEIWVYAIHSAINFEFGLAPYDYQYEHIRVVINDTDMCEKWELTSCVEYHALYDGKVEQVSQKGKYEGETYVNQESAEVSLNRMGNNLQGLIAKVGNERKNITLDVSTYGSRMKVGSIWYDDDNEKYIANVVQTTFSTSEEKVIVNAEFSKDFNLISQFTKIDQQKRFYEISQKLTTKGYENITEYLYFSYKDISENENVVQSALIGDDLLRTIVEGTLGGFFKRVDYATFRSYTHIDDVYPTSNYVYLPLHIYGSGNSLCFEMDYDDSLNAGNRLTGNGTSEALYSKTTLYTNDKNGFSDKVEIKLWFNGDNEGTYNDNFPIINTINDDELVSIEDFRYFKKPNEIFHLNYALAFMYDKPQEPFFFGNQFIENNSVIPTVDNYKKDLVFYYGNKLYSIIDNKPTDDSNEIVISSIDFDVLTNNGLTFLRVTINLNSAITCKSWTLCDGNNNILIASNIELDNSNSITFYVTPVRNRI